MSLHAVAATPPADRSRWRTWARRHLTYMALIAGLVGLPTPAQAVDTAAYISRVAPLALREQASYGTPASVSIAQSILESGWGGSTLSTQANNYFGIKCKATASQYQTGCYDKASLEYNSDGSSYSVVSSFRAYASATNSFLDHGLFLSSNARYQPAFAFTGNPDEFITRVAAAGYATDPQYAPTVISIMKRYNLYAYDTTRDQTPATAGPGGFTPMTPTRYLDTRTTQIVPWGGAVDVKIAGANEIPSSVVAVAVNVTVAEPTSPGWVTLTPTGEPEQSSNLNFGTNQIIANQAVVKIGRNGSITAHLHDANAHLIFDVTGYFTAPAATPDPGAVVAVNPTRLLDTRTTVQVPSGGDVAVTVAGRAGVPASGVSAAVLNLTATRTSAPGWVTAFPSGTSLPLASNINFPQGATVAALAMVRLGADGRVILHNSATGPIDVIVDVSGYVVAGQVTLRGGFVSMPPTRVMDTRTGIGRTGAIPPGGQVSFAPVSQPASAVAINLTLTDTTSNGFMTAWPAGTTRPNASVLNYAAGDTVANLGQLRTGAGGQITVGTTTAGSVALVADVAGYYLP